MTGFSGGDALERKLKEIAEKLGDGQVLRVGFLENAAYPDGTPVALVAGANEFGDPGRNRPPRPFFRSLIADKSQVWPKELGSVIQSCDYDIGQALGLMGERIRSQLQESIRAFAEPGLAESTIAAKSRGRVDAHSPGYGPEKPLIETGHMLNSVDYDIQED
jgi:hypothetical protein